MSLLDRCIFQATSAGTAAFVESAPVAGYQTMEAAGAVNGATYSYAAQSSDLSQWEYGEGVWSAGPKMLTRVPQGNSLGTTAVINFTAPPQVLISPLATDFAVSGPAGGDLSGTYPNPAVATFGGGTPFGTAAAENIGFFAQVANNLSDLASAATARLNLGLGTAATQASSFFLQAANNLSDLASTVTARTNLGLGSAATFASTAFLQAANNLSDLASAATARTNLGLGTAATQSTGFFAQIANNLSDLASAATARVNLGLGTAATFASSAFQAASAILSTLAGLATTKGNVIVGSGSTWAALGIGADGEVLTADSAQTDGVKWAPIDGPVGANPSATAGPAAIDGTAATFMRSDAAPAIQKASASQFGIVEVDGTTITESGGVISAAVAGANPTATAGPIVVDGSATTFMRSDAAPAVQIATTLEPGLVQPDGTTITIDGGGVISSLGAGISIRDTFANIVAQMPDADTLAWATDLGQFMSFDGASWWIDSSYLTLQPANNDIGSAQQSNRVGYGKDYITDKLIANSSIGGGPDVPVGVGAIRFNRSLGRLELSADGSTYAAINAGVPLRTIAAENYALENQPLSSWLKAFNGDSELLGLNGLPIVQGYHVSMGAYPPRQIMSGGTF